MMKKCLFAILLLCLGAASLEAQDRERFHDISFGIATPTGGFRYDYVNGTMWGTDLESMYETYESCYGISVFSMEYTYHAIPAFRFGAEFTYGTARMERYPGAAVRNAEPEYYEMDVLSLLPVAEWIYYQDSACSVYAKGGIGLEMALNGPGGTTLKPSWQLCPVGIHVGRKTFFMAELGVGTEYFLRLGAGFNF